MKFPFGKLNKKDREPSDPKEQRPKQSNGWRETVSRFFSPTPQKEKVLRHEDFHAVGDVYYASISAFYKVAQRILCVILIAFLLLSITIHHREITYDNFFYLLKDFSSAVDADSTTYEVLSYDSDTRHQFSLYRGGLAIVNPSAISAFSATGRRTLRQTSGFSSPFVISSDQYMLVYDTAGTSFSLYNSFVKVHTEQKEYPITNACFASDNSFVVVSRTARSKGVIYSYGKNFKFKGSIPYDYYLLDVALDADNQRMLSIGYDQGTGIGRTVISVKDYPFVYEKDATVNEEVMIEGEFPLACGFLNDKKMAIVTDSAIRIYDHKMNLLETVSYSSKTVRGLSVTEQGVILSTVYASQNEIIAFDKSGKLVYNSAVMSNATAVGIYEDFLFYQTDEGVTRIHVASDTKESLPCTDGKLLIYDDHTALVCGDAKAEYLIFGRND